jgi:Ca2+-binding RTX toxin-like protein
VVVSRRHPGAHGRRRTTPSSGIPATAATLSRARQEPTNAEPANDTLAINAFAGDDVLVGSAGSDTPFGRDGDDVLIGGLGQDVLDGGPATTS